MCGRPPGPRGLGKPIWEVEPPQVGEVVGVDGVRDADDEGAGPWRAGGEASACPRGPPGYRSDPGGLEVPAEQKGWMRKRGRVSEALLVG